MLTRLFVRRYEESLRDAYRWFYDDFDAYGRSSATTAVYFIPGINGVAGQLRFALPSFHRVFGPELFLRCCSPPEFSSRTPMWEKYTPENVDRKRDRIAADLNAMAGEHRRLIIVASSSGFYDLLHAAPLLGERVRERAELIWVSVAPDTYEPSVWEEVFSRVNGFEKDGHRWFAFPNSNLLAGLNPEAKLRHVWKHGGTARSFHRGDIESRFRCLGLQWCYTSRECFNAMLRRILERSPRPLDMKATVLVARNDGYWQGKPEREIVALLDTYLNRKQILWREGSHLWVLTPEAITDLLRLAGH